MICPKTGKTYTPLEPGADMVFIDINLHTGRCGRMWPAKVHEDLGYMTGPELKDFFLTEHGPPRNARGQDIRKMICKSIGPDRHQHIIAVLLIDMPAIVPRNFLFGKEYYPDTALIEGQTMYNLGFQ